MELARTWLVTVINPILRGLRKEKFWLSKQNWSWYSSTNKFEHLWPTEVYVDSAYQDNYTAFLRSYPVPKGAIQGRDLALDELAKACSALFHKFLQTPAFFQAVDDADRAATNAGINLNDARGAIPADQWPALLAQYIINSISSLPGYYATAPYWQAVGESLLQLREREPFQRDALAVEQAGGTLLLKSERVEAVLSVVREGYTNKFGLPPVPVGSESEETPSQWRMS